MKKKKGFIFIETLVVVAVLTASLLMTYSTYSQAVVKENIRIHYNDSAYMYRTFYFQQFFRNFRLDLVVRVLNDDENKGTVNMITGFNCYNTAIFMNSTNNQGLCENIFETLHISNIYLTYNDLGFVQDCNDYNGNCEILGRVREEAANYMKTIGGDGKSGYRVIVEYEECKDGTHGDGNNCNNNYEYYYTTLSLGEI